MVSRSSVALTGRRTPIVSCAPRRWMSIRARTWTGAGGGGCLVHDRLGRDLLRCCRDGLRHRTRDALGQRRVAPCEVRGRPGVVRSHPPRSDSRRLDGAIQRSPWPLSSTAIGSSTGAPFTRNWNADAFHALRCGHEPAVSAGTRGTSAFAATAGVGNRTNDALGSRPKAEVTGQWVAAKSRTQTSASFRAKSGTADARPRGPAPSSKHTIVTGFLSGEAGCSRRPAVHRVTIAT
jgi:hypothetical protein